MSDTPDCDKMDTVQGYSDHAHWTMWRIAARAYEKQARENAEYAEELRKALADLVDRCDTETEARTPCLIASMKRAHQALAKEPGK